MDWLNFIIGEAAQSIAWWQMCMRAALLFVIAVAMIRLGGSRIFGRHAVLDIVLAVILGSNISRTMTGNAPFVPVVIATALLIALHALLSILAQRSQGISRAVKGSPVKLAEGGEIDWDKMELTGVGLGDLFESMRSQGKKPDVENIDEAYLERSGDISIITKR
ncbi:MAG: DUF421 domain-containing protein [Persicimonas sp.]